MFLYLTTTGRISGQPRKIEIWFIERGARFYLIAEHRERANWVRNIQAQPQVKVRVGDRHFDATAPHVAGLSREGRMWVYVSAGTGTWGPPVRFGTSPEITLIKLVRV